MAAIDNGHLDAASTLLERGAEVNAKETNGGQTALMWATANKSPALVQLLLDRGADVHARSKGGFTPLLFAAQQGDVESGRILMQRADVNQRSDKDRKTALIIATASGNRDIAELLLDKGADPNLADESGFTALRSAASDKNGAQSGASALHAWSPPESPDHERLAGVSLCRREPDRRHAAFPCGVAR